MKLPLVWPPIETYHNSAFILGALLAYENTKSVYYNRYINLQCSNTNDIWDLGIEFLDIFGDDYRKDGIAEMDLFNIDNFTREKLPFFIEERISQGNYILLYGIDEYFLSYTRNHNKNHYIHDTYLYGYDDTIYYAMAYENNKLSLISVNKKEIIEGLFSCLSINQECSFCTFRPLQARTEVIDYRLIRRTIGEYIHFKDSCREECNWVSLGCSAAEVVDEKAFGNDIYYILYRCIMSIASRDSVNVNLDLRPFRVLWEHKKVMYDHLKLIVDKFHLQEDVLVKFENLQKLAHTIFMYSIKYNLSFDKKILYSIMEYLQKLYNEELNILIDFLNEWRRVN